MQNYDIQKAAEFINKLAGIKKLPLEQIRHAVDTAYVPTAAETAGHYKKLQKLMGGLSLPELSELKELYHPSKANPFNRGPESQEYHILSKVLHPHKLTTSTVNTKTDKIVKSTTEIVPDPEQAMAQVARDVHNTTPGVDRLIASPRIPGLGKLRTFTEPTDYTRRIAKKRNS